MDCPETGAAHVEMEAVDAAAWNATSPLPVEKGAGHLAATAAAERAAHAGCGEAGNDSDSAAAAAADENKSGNISSELDEESGAGKMAG